MKMWSIVYRCVRCKGTVIVRLEVIEEQPELDKSWLPGLDDLDKCPFCNDEHATMSAIHIYNEYEYAKWRDSMLFLIEVVRWYYGKETKNIQV